MEYIAIAISLVSLYFSLKKNKIVQFESDKSTIEKINNIKETVDNHSKILRKSRP